MPQRGHDLAALRRDQQMKDIPAAARVSVYSVNGKAAG